MDRLLDLTDQAEARHFWYQGFRSFLEPVFADVAAGRRDLQILDCGCGTGHNLSVLATYGRAFGFDRSPGGLERARRRNGAVARADATRMPFAADTFDLVTSFDMLQCMEPDAAAVHEMARVVRPGGAVVLTMAALAILHGDHSEAWREWRRYTPATARRLAEQAGLRVERVAFLFGSLFPLMLAVRTVQRLTRPFRAHRDDTDIQVPPAPLNAALAMLLRGEAALATYVPMPAGSSILVVARKPSAASSTAGVGSGVF